VGTMGLLLWLLRPGGRVASGPVTL
jgi:hypothetical protein